MGFTSSFIVVHYVKNPGDHCKMIEQVVNENKFLKRINKEWSESERLFKDFLYVIFEDGTPDDLETIDQESFVKKYYEYDWFSKLAEITSSTDMTIVGLYGLIYDGSLRGGPRYSSEPELFFEAPLFALLGDIPLFHEFFANNEVSDSYRDGYRRFFHNPTTNVDLAKPFSGEASTKIRDDFWRV